MAARGALVPADPGHRLTNHAGAQLTDVEFWSSLHPGKVVFVRYADDRWHERLLVAPGLEQLGVNGRSVWLVRTPDDDEFEEAIDGSGGDVRRAVVAENSGSTPAFIRGKAYRFRGSDYPDDDALLAAYWEQVPKATTSGRLLVPQSVYINMAGEETDIPAGAAPAAPAPPERRRRAKAPRDGTPVVAPVVAPVGGGGGGGPGAVVAAAAPTAGGGAAGGGGAPPRRWGWPRGRHGPGV